MTGRPAMAGVCSMISIPSAPGRTRSSRTRAGLCVRMRAATSPGSAVTTGLYPAPVSVLRTYRSVLGSSATTRMRAFCACGGARRGRARQFFRGCGGRGYGQRKGKARP